MTVVRTRGNTAKVGIATEGQHLEDVIEGTNVSIDKTDPLNPIISSSGGNLTNGNGTTANGTAVDLGGVVSSPAVFTGSSYMQFGDEFTPLSSVLGYGGIDSSLGKSSFEYISTGSHISASKLFGTYIVLNKSIGHYLKSDINDWGFHYSFKRGGDPEQLMLSFVPNGSTTWNTILNLGSDATGDIYHRNASGYLTRRGTVSAASTSSLTIDSDTTYQYSLTALAAALTIEAPTGTPFNGQDLLIRIKDNGVARALTWNGTFQVIGVTLPTTTVISKTMYIACIYNSTDIKWDVIGVREQA